MPNTCIDKIEHTRAILVEEVRAGSDDDRTLELSFSSEEPYLRDIGGELVWEVLGHRNEEVDLSRLETGAAPLLKDHRPDLDHQVGRVLRVWVERRRGMALVRFNDTPAGREMWERVRSKDVQSVSVGYRITGHTRDGERDGHAILRASWVPHEISLVALPADPTVGIGRSMGGARGDHPQSMEGFMPATPEPTPNGVPQSVAAERARVTEINAIAQQFDIPREDVADAITRGTTLNQFRQDVMGHISSQDGSPTHSRSTRAALGAPLLAGPEQPYSLMRVVSASVSGDWSGAAFERECSEELRRRSGRAAQGVFIPADALAQRDLITTANAPSMIGTEHMGAGFIEALRPQTQVLSLGATILNGLRDNVSIPRMPTGLTAEWIAEDAQATESNPVFDAVSLSLRQLSANTRMSRRQVKQADPALDTILRNDMLRQIAVGVDRAAINGAGNATEPRGILNTVGIGSVSAGTNGAWVSWPMVTELMAAVEAANVPMAGLGFLSNHKVKAAMLSTAKFADGGSAILTADRNGASIAGHVAAFTSLVPDNGTKGTGTALSSLIFGAWADLLIGQWGGIDVIVDTSSEASKGNVRIAAHSEWDIAVRHAESFAAITDIETVRP